MVSDLMKATVPCTEVMKMSLSHEDFRDFRDFNPLKEGDSVIKKIGIFFQDPYKVSTVVLVCSNLFAFFLTCFVLQDMVRMRRIVKQFKEMEGKETTETAKEGKSLGSENHPNDTEPRPNTSFVVLQESASPSGGVITQN